MCSVARKHSISIPLSCVSSILHIETIFNSSFFVFFLNLNYHSHWTVSEKARDRYLWARTNQNCGRGKNKYMKNRQQLCWGCSEVKSCFLNDLNETVFRHMIIFFWLILLLIASGLRFNFILWSMAEDYIKLKEAQKGKMGNRAYKRQICILSFFGVFCWF